MPNFRYELQWVDIPNVPGTKSARALERIDTAIFHRIHAGDPEQDDAASIAAFFAREGKRWIGTDVMPYPLIVPRDQPGGDLVIVQQCCPLWGHTPHAYKWNTRAVGIGVVGDFRTMKPTQKQKAACLWIAQRLQDVCAPHLKKLRKDFLVTVHGALTTATKDPEKLIGGKNECPGKFFLPVWRKIRKDLAAGGRLKI